MALALRQRIDAPASGANRRGLLSPGGASIVTDTDERWVGGVRWEDEACEFTGPRPVVCDEDSDKEPVESPGEQVADAVYLLGSDTCSTASRTDEAAVERARRNLRATESHQLEQELWDGVASRMATPDPLENVYLATATGEHVAEVLADDPVGYANALAELEQALAECLHGTQGMIHAVPLTVDLWWEAGLLRVEGQRLLTPMDNIVVAGSGYSGSAPGASEGDPPVEPADIAAEANAYATGLVHVRLGTDHEVSEGVRSGRYDRLLNDITVLIERPALITFNHCCLFTIPVDHTSAGIVAAP